MSLPYSIVTEFQRLQDEGEIRCAHRHVMERIHTIREERKRLALISRRLREDERMYEWEKSQLEDDFKYLRGQK